jgi:hypothetical protein
MTTNDLLDDLDLERNDLAAVRGAAEDGDLSAVKRELARHLWVRPSPRWYFSWRDRPAPTKHASDFPRAERFLDREFTFGFHGAPDYTAKFGARIDWGANPTEGEYRTHLWNESLNRHFHFSDLSEAYWETGDERFAQGLVRDWVEWIELNPRPVDSSGNDVEWPYGCYAWQTLTTAIRLERTWPEALYRCLGSPAFTDEAIWAIYGSVRDQARHLVKWPTGHNWLTEESMALFTAGTLFPELREAGEWRKTGIDRLYTQLTDEVYPDGAEYELAAGYGNWVVRNFVNLLERAKLNGHESELPGDLVARMEKMFDYVLNVSMPNVEMPGLNDSSNADVKELLQTGHALFPERQDLLYLASSRRRGRAPDQTSCGLPYSGHYVMRSGWDADAVYMLLDSGPYGSAHQHEDKLHFVLYAYGKQHILDPGNFSYDASRWRRYVLTTPGHNTVMVDGQGQNRRANRDTYFWPRPWTAAAPPDNDTDWISGLDFDHARGVYRDGYGPENDKTVTHTRSVIFVKPEYWLVIDELCASDDTTHAYEGLFHLDTSDVIVDENTRQVATANSQDSNLVIAPMVSEGLGLQIVSGRDDPVQGWANDPWRPVPTAIYSKSGSGTVWFLYVLFPVRAGVERPSLSVEALELTGTSGVAAVVRFGDGRADYVAVSQTPGTWAAFDRFRTDGEVALIRTGADKRTPRAFLSGGSAILFDGQPIHSD